MTKPVLGRDYYPRQTLRQMPRHWVLEEATAAQKWSWWRDGDFWVGAVCLAFGMVAVSTMIREMFL